MQLRPVRAQDLTPMRDFVRSLSAASRQARFHGGIKPDSERLLRYLSQADGVHHIAFVAVLACDDGDVIVGEARCVRAASGESSAEFAIAVADAWQGRAVAPRLLHALRRAAAAAGIRTLFGDVLAGNARMAAFMRRHGFAPAGAAAGGVQRWSGYAPCDRLAAPGSPLREPGNASLPAA
ncbi:MAG: GNAT family N-acetyltransferase [Burkholderiales bacterium]|nr:GNAT family N-acetyltransferase [Burkholderiales bacterium]